MGAEQKAQSDRESGDLGAARRRLMSLHDSGGYSPRLCRLIGELSLEMRDPTEAGRWLLISDAPRGTPMEAAIGLFLASCHHDKSIVMSRLPRVFKRMRYEELSQPVAERLSSVGIDTLHRPPTVAVSGAKRSALERLAGFGCVSALVLAGLVFVVGLWTIINTIFR